MAKLNTLYIKDDVWNKWLDLIYPVGAIYMSWNSTSPASLFGGTWTAITSGRYLSAAANINTGGSSSVSHRHYTPSGYKAGESYAYISPVDSNSYDLVNKGTTLRISVTGSGMTAMSGDRRYGSTTSSSVKIEPPYQNLYIWHRTA